MFGKFLPHTTDFFDFFERHVKDTSEASQILLEMLQKKPENQTEAAETIAKLEKSADKITHECIAALHKTFITPFEHLDIHRLISGLDDILDMIEDISAEIIIFKLDTTTRPDAFSLAHLLVLSINEIKEIFTHFRKKQFTPEMQKHFQTLHKYENEGDALVRESLGRLFDEEKQPITLIKWKEIYEHLEDAIDCCEEVAHIAEGVLIENS